MHISISFTLTKVKTFFENFYFLSFNVCLYNIFIIFLLCKPVVKLL